jgi:glycosyltransferase involved in cell wall biosynthesis
MNNRPRLLVLSHVLPFPRSTGQQQRVFYTLQSLRAMFHLTFATAVADEDRQEVRTELAKICDDVILLPSLYQGTVGKAKHRIIGTTKSLTSGLRFSNYLVGQLEFSSERLRSIFSDNHFDCVLLEYWHATNSVFVFKDNGIPCVLDMHNILWQSYVVQLKAESNESLGWWKRFALARYKSQEEAAWSQFDAVIAINQEELKYVKAQVPKSTEVFYGPMGTDLSLWPYSWDPGELIRIGYYGGLSSPHNCQAALQCYNQIMPAVWNRYPQAELWLIGSDPPDSLRDLTSDHRVKVTGYVEHVQGILQTMSLVLCPWSGTYGFRSRLIEVMALGVPLVASYDAVSGMELENGRGVLLGRDDYELVEHVLNLLQDKNYSRHQSGLARQQVEQLYSIDNTYGKLTGQLCAWLNKSRS